MCQVNIALGILYLNLKESRYREKLIETILGKLAASGCDDMDVRSTPYIDIMNADKTFADHHHYILDWIGEVPTNKLTTKWTKWKEILNHQQRNRPLWIKRDRPYFWYNYRVDKWLTLFLLVIFPILSLWLSEFYSEFAVKSAAILWFWLGIGQFSIVMHVLFGRIMAIRIGRKITRRSEYMSRKLNEHSADLQADEVNPSLAPE